MHVNIYRSVSPSPSIIDDTNSTSNDDDDHRLSYENFQYVKI